MTTASTPRYIELAGTRLTRSRLAPFLARVLSLPIRNNKTKSDLTGNDLTTLPTGVFYGPQDFLVVT